MSSNSESSSNLGPYPKDIYPSYYVASMNRAPPMPAYVPGQPRPIYVQHPTQLSEKTRRKLFLKTGRLYPRWVGAVPAMSNTNTSSEVDTHIDAALLHEDEQTKLLAYRKQKADKRTLKARRTREYKMLRNVEELARAKEYQRMRKAARKTYRGKIRAERVAVARELEARQAEMAAEEAAMRATMAAEARANRRTLRKQWMAAAAGAPTVGVNRRTMRAAWMRAAAGLPQANEYANMPALAPAAQARSRAPRDSAARIIANYTPAPGPSARRKKAANGAREKSDAEKRMLARASAGAFGAAAKAKSSAAAGGGGGRLAHIAEEEEEE